MSGTLNRAGSGGAPDPHDESHHSGSALDNLKGSLFTAAGSLIYSTAADTAAERLAGTDGYVMTMSGGLPIWLPSAALSVTTKGDIQTYTTVPARLAVGPQAQGLYVDSSTATGLLWDKPLADYLNPTGAIAVSPIGRADGLTNQNSFLVSQRVQLYAISLPKNTVITSISFFSGSGALATGVNQVFGLYDSSRALLRSTTDDTSTAWAAQIKKTLSLTSTFTTTYRGLHYVAILINATTTPTLIGTTNGFAITNEAPILGGTADTSQTSLPANAAALTATILFPWFYVS